MALKKFVQNSWPAVRDNAFYDVLKLAAIVIGVPLGNKLVNYVLSIATSLAPEEVRWVSTICTLLLVTAVSVTWALVATRRRAAAPLADSAVSITRLEATPPQLLPVPHLPTIQGVPDLVSVVVNDAAKDPNLHIELQEMLFLPQRVGLLIASGCNILMRLHIVNRGSIEATITEWDLRVVVGSETFTAEVTTIPLALKIETPGLC